MRRFEELDKFMEDEDIVISFFISSPNLFYIAY